MSMWQYGLSLFQCDSMVLVHNWVYYNVTIWLLFIPESIPYPCHTNRSFSKFKGQELDYNNVRKVTRYQSSKSMIRVDNSTWLLHHMNDINQLSVIWIFKPDLTKKVKLSIQICTYLLINPLIIPSTILHILKYPLWPTVDIASG